MRSLLLTSLFVSLSWPVQAQTTVSPPTYVQPAPPAAYTAPPAYAPPASAPAPVYTAPVQAAPAPAQPAYNYAAPAPAPVQPAYHYVAPAPSPAQPVYNYVVPAGYPPPPPGYVYVPVQASGAPGDVARRDALYAELHQVESQLDRLEREQKGIGGPIARIIIGYGTTLIFSGVALAAYEAAEDIEHEDYYEYHNGYRYDRRDELDFNNNGTISEKDEKSFRTLSYVTGGIAAGGLLLGVSGTIALVRRNAERRKSAHLRNSLQARRSNLRQQLDYGVGMSSGQLRLNVSGRF